MSLPALHLKPGRERSLQHRHPWIFSGAVAHLEGEPAPGETVALVSSKGERLALAAYSPASQIRARVWTFDPDETVGPDFLRSRLKTCLQARQALDLAVQSDALRLVYAESDGLPGLVVDRYGPVLVLQALSAGAELWRETFVDLLVEQTGLADIYERSDADVRALEGLPARSGALCGSPADRTVIHENGLEYRVDLAGGHKTGFYLDQRANRARLRALAANREVLDCFCYSGGFSLNALAGGARSVLSVDASAEALALLRENLAANPLPADRLATLEGDVFQLLRRFRDEGRSFDLVVLDPPKFAPTASQAAQAARGYKDINLLAFKLLRPGGLLASFSCSGGVDADLFQKILAGAALDAGAEVQVLERLSQAADHPVALNFPEGSYLKGLVCLKR